MKQSLLLISVFILIFSANSFGQKLYINEFMASNDAVAADENGEYDDWIEIYNAESTPVDIGGMYLSDALGTLTTWQIPTTAPDSTTIPAGGFLVLWADKQPEQGILHINLKLSSGGEDIVLTSSDGTTIIDSYTFGAQTTDISFGRMPDGSTNWQQFGYDADMGYTASPGRSNVTLKINEFLAKNNSVNQDEFGNFGDWIELYNYGASNVDITGMFMTDVFDNPTQYTFNPAVVPAGGYLLIWCDGTSTDPITNPDTLHANFKLGAGGERVGLYLNEFTVIDSVTFGAQTADISYGRYPDGTDSWITFTLPTPGETNVFASGPVISDVVREPMFPEYTDNVIITANITTTAAELVATLKYNAGSGDMDVQMLDDGLHNDGLAGDNVFGGSIPAQGKGINVNWYIQASDKLPSQSFYPADAPVRVLSYKVTDWTPANITELAIREPSGLVYNKNTGTLFTNSDGNDADIFEIDTNGVLQNTLPVKGADFEGITFNATYDTIYVVEETDWKIVKYTLDGTRISEINVSHQAGQTSGLEGITIDHQNGHIFALHEKNNPELIEFTRSGQEISRTTLSFSSDISGITIHPIWQTLFIVSDEGQTLNEVTKSGEFLRSWYIPLDQAEGVTFGADEHTIYMVSDRGNKLYEFAFDFEQYTPAPTLLINEFMASNDFAAADEFGEYDDWIEIYNAGTETVDIGGYYITDDLSNPTQWRIPDTAPDSTTVAPGGFLLLWADKQPEQGVRHINIKLGAGGEDIGLYLSDGVGVVDTLTYGKQTTDISYGRKEDGGDAWGFFSGVTPGASNSGGTLVGIYESADAVISEYSLCQNYPNPFNPLTTIQYQLSAAGPINLTVYNSLGQIVQTLVEGWQKKGSYTVTFNAAQLASGIYYYKLSTDSYTKIRKMILMK